MCGELLFFLEEEEENPGYVFSCYTSVICFIKNLTKSILQFATVIAWEMPDMFSIFSLKITL